MGRMKKTHRLLLIMVIGITIFGVCALARRTSNNASQMTAAQLASEFDDLCARFGEAKNRNEMEEFTIHAGSKLDDLHRRIDELCIAERRSNFTDVIFDAGIVVGAFLFFGAGAAKLFRDPIFTNQHSEQTDEREPE